MSTRSQIEANRANSQHSTGPCTKEGKANSSRNRFKNGFCGRFQILDNESKIDFQLLLESLLEEYAPIAASESMLISRLAENFWLGMRAREFQTMALTSDHPVAERERAFVLYMRYGIASDNAFSKSLRDLLKLKEQRSKEQIGFERKRAEEAKALLEKEAQEAKLKRQNTIKKAISSHPGTPLDQLKDFLHAAAVEFFENHEKTTRPEPVSDAA